MNELHTLRYASSDDRGDWQYQQCWFNFIHDTSDMNGRSNTRDHLRTRLKKEYRAVWNEHGFEIDFERQEDMVMFVLRWS